MTFLLVGDASHSAAVDAAHGAITTAGGVATDTAIQFAIALLTASLIAGFIRIMRGPALADRVVALDFLVVTTVAWTALVSIAANQSAFLDVGIAVALVGFLGTTAFARYLEERYRAGDDAAELDRS